MQYVVKPAYSGTASAFQWHRDGDWLASHDAEDVPYISVWHQYYLKHLQCYAKFTCICSIELAESLLCFMMM